MSPFAPATRTSVRLRMSLQGPSGSGKTYTALSIATALGEKVAVIDTEHGSAALYADQFAFDTVELKAPFGPDRYIELMFDAAKADYDVLVIDSLSHAWAGQGGILELVDQETAKSRSGNSFQAWGKVGTPLQNRLVEKLLAYPGHVLFTMRSKVEWVLEEDDRGRKVPRKIGMAAVQRDGVDYEVSVAVELNHDHTLFVTKSRFADLADLVIPKPGAEFAERIKTCLGKFTPTVGLPFDDPNDDTRPFDEPDPTAPGPGQQDLIDGGEVEG